MIKETSKKMVIEFIKNLLYEDLSKADIKMKVKEKFPKFKTLGRAASYKVKGWELGQHGDVGRRLQRQRPWPAAQLVRQWRTQTRGVRGGYRAGGRSGSLYGQQAAQRIALWPQALVGAPCGRCRPSGFHVQVGTLAQARVEVALQTRLYRVADHSASVTA